MINVILETQKYFLPRKTPTRQEMIDRLEDGYSSLLYGMSDQELEYEYNLKKE